MRTLVLLCGERLSSSTPEILVPFIGVRNIDRDDGNLIYFGVFRSHDMERTFALKAQNQSTGFGHLRGVILDGFPQLKRLSDFPGGNSTLEHALNCMDTEEKFGLVHS